MKTLLCSILAVVLFVAGCTAGDVNVPGNRKHLDVNRTVTTTTIAPSGTKTVVVDQTHGQYIANGANSDVGSFTYNGLNGTITATAVKTTDVVAGEQSASAQHISDNATTATHDILNFAALAMGKGSLPANPLAGGGTVTPTPAGGTVARSAAGQAIVTQALAMLANCPKIAAADKPAWAKQINSVPPGYEDQIINIETMMGVNPANVTPAAVKKP